MSKNLQFMHPLPIVHPFGCQGNQWSIIIHGFGSQRLRGQKREIEALMFKRSARRVRTVIEIDAAAATDCQSCISGTMPFEQQSR